MKDVIRENAEQMDMDAELPDEVGAEVSNKHRSITKFPMSDMATAPGAEVIHEIPPTCMVSECSRKVNRHCDGNWFKYWFDHTHLAYKAAPRRVTNDDTKSTLVENATGVAEGTSNNTSSSGETTNATGSSAAAADTQNPMVKRKQWNQCRLEGCTQPRYQDPEKG